MCETFGGFFCFADFTGISTFCLNVFRKDMVWLQNTNVLHLTRIVGVKLFVTDDILAARYKWSTPGDVLG